MSKKGRKKEERRGEMKKHQFWAWCMVFCGFMVFYTGYKHK